MFPIFIKNGAKQTLLVVEPHGSLKGKIFLMTTNFTYMGPCIVNRYLKTVQQDAT